MIAQAEDVLNTARMFLNDNGSANPQLWTDPVLMPMLQRAHQELQVTLRQRAAPIMKAHSLGVINPGTQQFPTISDIVSPIQLVEAAPGGIGTLMTEADPIPLIAPRTNLNYWHWDGTNILFTGATSVREVLTFYWRSLPLPASGADSILVIDGEMWLAPRTAAIAAASVGEENTSAAAANNAASTLEQVILANRGRAPQLAGISVRP